MDNRSAVVSTGRSHQRPRLRRPPRGPRARARTYGACTAPGGGIEILDPVFEEYLGPGDPQDYEWCPAARLESTYDFGRQRRVKREANITDDVGRIPEGASLYVSASYEVREATWNGSTEQYENGIDARYLWNEAGILFELDSEVPDGAPSPKTRLTLTNQIGSASSVLDADLGAVAHMLSQLPYGAEEQTLPRVDLTDPPAFVPRYEFTGKERDRGVGLVYFGARSLDARLGRWTSVDPLAHHERLSIVGSSTLAAPYAYADVRPVVAIDPDGRDVFVIIYDAAGKPTESAGATANAMHAAVAFTLQREVSTRQGLDPNDDTPQDIVIVVPATADPPGDDYDAGMRGAVQYAVDQVRDLAGEYGPMRELHFVGHDFRDQGPNTRVPRDSLSRSDLEELASLDWGTTEPRTVPFIQRHGCGAGPEPDKFSQTAANTVGVPVRSNVGAVYISTDAETYVKPDIDAVRANRDTGNAIDLFQDDYNVMRNVGNANYAGSEPARALADTWALPDNPTYTDYSSGTDAAPDPSYPGVGDDSAPNLKGR